MLLFFFPLFLIGQGKIVGNITDADTNEPLIGATVLIQGTINGVITDIDGNFEFANVDAGNYTLEASYTGFGTVSQEVTVTDGIATVDYSLFTSATELDEIVVTGTGGPVEKKRIGNSIGTISTKRLEDMPINSFSDILQGREPGIVAFPGGGLTGEGAQIRIRGNASLSQLNEPIILVDGIRVDRGGGFSGLIGSGGGGSTSRLDDINPESIESIEILKGASAATLFGTEASNGVIQIFTKKGQTGAPKFDFKLAQGFISFPKGAIADNVGFTSSPERAAELSTFYGETIQPYQLIRRNFTEELYETGKTTQLSGSISGGTGLFNYFVSARYAGTDGPFGGQDRNYPAGIQTEATDKDNLSQLNLNLNIKPTEKVFIRLTSGYTDRFSTTMQNNNNIFGVGSLAQFSKPELATDQNQTGTIAFATVNETLQIALDTDTKHYNGSIGINYYPLDWLKLDGTFGVDFSNVANSEFWPFRWNIDNFAGANPNGWAGTSNRKFIAQTLELKGTLSHTFGEISSDLILGGQLTSQEELITSGSGEAFPGPGFEVTGAAANQTVFEAFTEVINAGVFAQEQVGFGNSLFLTLGARLDAHSAFGSNFNAQIYPKVALSYVASDAEWWSGNVGPISSLQLRGSYGWAGLQPGAFDALTTYQALASTTGAGIAPNNLGNPDLSPEISKEWEAGITAGLFNNRANLEFTYWDRTVEDALYARQFPLTGGWRNAQLVNIGQLDANGIELSLNGTVFKSKNLKVDVFANGAYIQEEVTDLGGAPPLKVGGSYPRYRNFLIEGSNPGANFGAVLMPVSGDALPVDIANGDGQPDTKAQLLAFLADAPDAIGNVPNSIGTGAVLLMDEDGDGDFLDHYLGKSTPDWQGSFGATVSFGSFRLNTTFEYKAGDFAINNLTDAFRQANPAIGRNLPTSAQVVRDYQSGGVDGSGTPQNDPEVRYNALKDWLYENLALAPFSGLNTIEKADFIRWRELALTYRLPLTSIEGIGLKNASISLSGRNLALLTGYTGVDPEINFVGRGSGSSLDQNFGQGIAAFGWPIPRTIMFTLKAGF